MPRDGSCSCRWNCWSNMAAASTKYFGQADAERARRDRSIDRRGTVAFECGLRAARRCPSGGAAGFPAAGVGPPRFEADIAGRFRSVRAADGIAIANTVDAVACIALAGVW